MSIAIAGARRKNGYNSNIENMFDLMILITFLHGIVLDAAPIPTGETKKRTRSDEIFI